VKLFSSVERLTLSIPGVDLGKETSVGKIFLTISFTVLLVLVSCVVGSRTGNELVGQLGLVVCLLELLHGLGLIGV